MITWNKLQKMNERDPWLVEALERLRNCDDERSVERRAKERSIAFVAFKPFEKANPFWVGQIGSQPFFHTSKMAGSDGCLYTSYPTVVSHLERSSDYYFSVLSPSGCTSWDCSVEMCMRDLLKDERTDGMEVIIDAVIKPLVIKLNPHRMFAESYEVYKIPENFDFEEWVSEAKRQKAMDALRMGRTPYIGQKVEAADDIALIFVSPVRHGDVGVIQRIEDGRIFVKWPPTPARKEAAEVWHWPSDLNIRLRLA
jgi:hypothetical protein